MTPLFTVVLKPYLCNAESLALKNESSLWQLTGKVVIFQKVTGTRIFTFFRGIFKISEVEPVSGPVPCTYWRQSPSNRPPRCWTRTRWPHSPCELACPCVASSGPLPYRGIRVEISLLAGSLTGKGARVRHLLTGQTTKLVP
jgi:hypothetical protein